MSAEERRESVVRAAIAEFARGGYHGTSTEAIARRVGVSQPYLFRLFPGKQAIFLAAVERCQQEILRTFREASEGVAPEDAKRTMGLAYEDLIARDRGHAADAAPDVRRGLGRRGRGGRGVRPPDPGRLGGTAGPRPRRPRR
ncbi:hypothetical protein GCM10020221_09910 [Streptomyces thioluteus]|uniref:HTH tetR-type domain-containing protein n=1 Tax=Streptomyces thioluteus TaxID=66431 RepID=A0ABN3WIS5_STRTU